MVNAIDKLVISLGFDSVELNEGLRKASRRDRRLRQARGARRRALDRLAATASKTGLMMGGVSDEVAERVMSIGTAGQKTSLVMGRAMDGISARVGKVGALLKTALGPVLAVFAGGKIFSGLSQMGESLDVLSERTGVAVDKIDAWAKANRDAGGSEEAFKSALENWTVEKGRSADDFFRMGEAVKGMSQQQAAYFMRAMGLSQDAAAVFTKFTDKASSAAKAYEGMAMTSEQAKAAREMNIRWRQFTDQAQALGNVLGVTVTPGREPRSQGARRRRGLPEGAQQGREADPRRSGGGARRHLRPVDHPGDRDNLDFLQDAEGRSRRHGGAQCDDARESRRGARGRRPRALPCPRRPARLP